MTDWKAPLKLNGEPCRKCIPGRLCPNHRLEHKANPGPRNKLTREVVDDVSRLAVTATGHRILWEAAAVHPGTFYRWLDDGEQHALEGRVSLEREIYEVVRNQRRIVASKLRDAAYEVALGHKATRVTKRGEEEVYDAPPDGRLAASLASRLDPRQLPPERAEVEHSGVVETPTRLILGFDPKAFPKPKAGDAV